MKTTRTLAIFVLTLGLVVGLAAGVVKADFTFGVPTNMGPTVNTSSADIPDCFSSDGLEMYFSSLRPGGYGNWDIWVARRSTIDDDWGAPENLGPPVNTSQEERFASTSTDGLELYFSSYNRPGGYGYDDIWVAKRATRNDAWGVPVNLGTPINTSGFEHVPCLSTDGLELYFCAYTGGYSVHDIFVTRRVTKNDAWEPPINLGAVINSPASEGYPFLSADGLVLFLSENKGELLRPGGFGDVDMWVTTRASISEPWDTPMNLGPIVNSTSLDYRSVISPDGFMLYFSSERPGGYGARDLWQAPILPIVDFNGDGMVDAADMCIMVDYWGEYYPLCDIGPMPWGDGIVDVEDLMVLVEHLFEEVP